jgi:hypothetical protein
MEKFKSILGYSWAIMAVPVAFLIVFSSPLISDGLFGKDGVKVTDRLSGGEVREILEKEDYSIYLHEPVFDGFFFERDTGFVQIDFISQTELPLNIEEDIDYDSDNKTDFIISINTQSNEYELTPVSQKVKELSDEEVYVLENRRTIRVELIK